MDLGDLTPDRQVSPFRGTMSLLLNEDASLSDLWNKLVGIHVGVKNGFVVIVNGVLMGQLRGVDTKLSEGNNVILMTLISGGWCLSLQSF